MELNALEPISETWMSSSTQLTAIWKKFMSTLTLPMEAHMIFCSNIYQKSVLHLRIWKKLISF
ncbi:hypothetical protein [Rubritalea tangerina]|uniref:hypothetical protein n=1 Tax=Rubritalea tangerina TaxID=430798 RepID=UPI00361F5157